MVKNRRQGKEKVQKSGAGKTIAENASSKATGLSSQKRKKPLAGKKANNRVSKRGRGLSTTTMEQNNDKAKGENAMRVDEEAMEEEEPSTRGASTSAGAGSASLRQHSTLQGLLKKLGAGLEDLLPTGAGGSGAGGSGSAHHNLFSHSALFGGSSSLTHRLKPILAGLKSFDDEHRQLGALTELCDVLTVSSEEALVSSFSCEAFLPPLVDLLRCEHNPDVALFAGRALTTLADLMPPRMAVGGMLRLGAADAFCAKLMCVEYIDVAEQSLQAMEKITSAGEEHAAACLRSGGVTAVLSFLDFFQTGVQRVAAKTAANMLACASTKQDVAMVKDSLPILVNLLSYGDDKIVENAFLGLSRALKAMCSCAQGQLDDESVSTILSTQILDGMAKLLVVSEFGSMHSSLGTSSYYEAIKSLSRCCRKSPLLAERLLDLDLSVTCTRLLQCSTMAGGPSAGTTPKAGATPGSPAASPMVSPGMRSTENTLAILKLVDAMLPEIPSSGRALDAGAQQLAFGSQPASHPIEVAAQATGSSFGGVLERKPDLVEGKACRVLLPTLFGMVSSTLAYQLKQVSLSCMKKLLVYTSPQGLEEMLRELPASSTVVGLLSSKDSAVQLDAIFLAGVLLDKLPEIFVRYFMKEGVLFSVNGIADRPVQVVESREGAEEEAPGGSEQRRERRRSRGRQGPSEGFVTPTAGLPAKVSRAAKDFQAKFARVSAEHGVSSDSVPKEMEALQELARGIERGEATALSSMLDRVLADGGGLSSFELTHTGLERALLAYFSGKTAGESYSLAAAFAGCLAGRANPEEVYRTLVKRLHEIVSSRERLAVMACRSRPPSMSTMRYLLFERGQAPDRQKEAGGFAALAHPFKLRFSRHGDERELRDYSSNVVLVEPMSTFEVIEDFLRSRVEPPRSAARESGPSPGRTAGEPVQRQSGSAMLTRSRSRQRDGAEAEAQGGQESSPPRDPEEQAGRRVTRSAARAATENAAEDAGPPVQFHVGEGEVEFYDDDDDDDMMDGSDMEGDPMDEEDLDMLDDDMEGADDDDMDDGDGYRFRRDSEVHEVDDSPSQEEAAAVPPGGNYAQRAARGGLGLEFFLNGEPLSSNQSVFQAVLRGSGAFVNADDPQDGPSGPGVWERVHTFTYRKKRSGRTGGDPAKRRDGRAGASAKSKMVSAQDLVKGAVATGKEGAEEVDKEIAGVLGLINILAWLQGNHPRCYGSDPNFAFLSRVSKEDLVSPRLASKVARQLQDLLIICGKCLPEWVHGVVRGYPLVFPFDLRRQYLHLTALGVPHAIQHVLQQIPNGDSLRQELRDVRLVRNRRQKVRIHRDKLLGSAAKVMELYGSSKASLEVEYFGEVGTGLGPTLEFYTLLSQELQGRGLGIWLTNEAAALGSATAGGPHGTSDAEMAEATANDDDGLIFGEMEGSDPRPGGSAPREAPRDPAGPASQGESASDYVDPPGDGLFPSPNPRPSKSDLAHFRLLGTAFAKALYDGRLLDVSLSTVFWRRALGERLTVRDLAAADAEMSRSLVRLHDAAHAEGFAGEMDGCPIEDLGLNFTLPGREDYELCKGGKAKAVTGKNVKDFVSRVLDAYFGKGTDRQFQSFREGFEDVFPLETLSIFDTMEIDRLFCGQSEKWTVEMLADCLKFDHGYTASSPYIKQFLHILADFDSEEQRQFLKFVTGAPRLPPGGLSALNPKLTIVRKNFSSANRDSAGNTPRSESLHTPVNELVLENYDLPSVMTCANYVKLPPYTSQAVMREKLMYAMREGQHSFNLS